MSALSATPHAVAAALPEALRAKVPAQLLQRLEQHSGPQNLIVEFEHAAVRARMSEKRLAANLERDDQALLAEKKQGYDAIKARAFEHAATGGARLLRDYSHLPKALMQVPDRRALELLLAHPEVAAVYENRRLRPQLVESLPLISQPLAVSGGASGAGTMVALLDTGVDYTLPAFGNCTAPGVPAGCRIAVSLDFALPDSARDDDGHGTHLAAVIAAVAPSALIASLDVFEVDNDLRSPTFGLNLASDSDIMAAINDWVIPNAAARNIVALNLAVGSEQFSTECSGALGTAFQALRERGVLPVVAAGNEAFANAISYPACLPGAVRVGAVYDANVGGRTYPTLGCADASTAADRVTCFSNSSSLLTVLAPGALVTAAGITQVGTSPASAMVSGAAAVLRAAWPGDTPDATVSRMINTGVPITYTRTAGAASFTYTKPRIDLAPAVGATSIVLTSAPGSGADITFTATVSGNNAARAPSGTVTFRDGGTVLGTATLVGGVARLTVPSLSAGAHSISAVYNGDAFNLARVSNALVEVSSGNTASLIQIIIQLLLN